MIERFRKEIDWGAADSAARVTTLFRQMLFEYVKDYRARGEAALIEYNDKRDHVSIASEQRALEKAGFVAEGILRSAQHRRGEYHDLVMYAVIRNQ